MRIQHIFGAGVIVLSLAACTHTQPVVEAECKCKDEVIETKVHVIVTPAKDGNYEFRYAGRFADRDGNIDLTRPGAKGKTVVIDFELVETPASIRFNPDGRQAIWIANAVELKRGRQPFAAYDGGQFLAFATVEGGRRLQLVNQNDDGRTYVYKLRLNENGEPLMHDPTIRNGTKGGHTLQ